MSYIYKLLTIIILYFKVSYKKAVTNAEDENLFSGPTAGQS